MKKMIPKHRAMSVKGWINLDVWNELQNQEKQICVEHIRIWRSVIFKSFIIFILLNKNMTDGC